jgi:hypothetical protein
MASINLSELHIVGSELFQDSESFINELNNVESIVGGSDGFSSNFDDVADFGIKGWEFGLLTYGIDAIGHIVKSFTSAN